MTMREIKERHLGVLYIVTFMRPDEHSPMVEREVFSHTRGKARSRNYRRRVTEKNTAYRSVVVKARARLKEFESLI